MKYLIVTLITLFWTISIFAQPPVHVTNFQKYLAPICQNDATLFIDSNGKVAFTLPEGHEVIREPGDSELNVFSEGIAVIMTKEKEYYWINEKGEKVKDFGLQYLKIHPFKNGYARAWKKVRGFKKGNMIFFLNKNGEELFDGKPFHWADPFLEGFAKVRLEKEGLYSFINKNGEIAIDLDSYINQKISGVNGFHDGLARIQSRTEKPINHRDIINYFFINRKGEKVIDIKELYPDKVIHKVGDFSDGWVAVAFVQLRSNLYDLVFLDKSGNEMLKLENVKEYGTTWKDGFNYYVEGKRADGSKGYTYTSYWIDRQGKREKVKLNDTNKILRAIKKRQDYFEFQISYNGNNHCTGLYERNPLKEVYFTEDRLLDYDETHALTVNEETNTHTLTRISDGKILWQTRIEERFFNSLSEAIKYKERVTRFKMNNIEKIDKQFYELKNLQFLSLNNVNTLVLRYKSNIVNCLQKSPVCFCKCPFISN